MSHRRVVLTVADHIRIVTLVGSHPDLVKLLNSAPMFTPASDMQIEAAQEIHSCDEIEIDDGAGSSNADDGYWVEGWLWVGA